MQIRRCIVAILVSVFSLALIISSVEKSVAENSNIGGRQFYVSSRSGSDSGDGRSQTPWRSLQRLADVTFRPGDTIFIAAGSRFEGGFEINESGTSNAPIVITRYGEGPAPRFTNPHSTVLDGSGIRVNGSYVVVDGLCLEKCPANPVATDVHLLGAIFLTTN
ncbi:MAG: hypothetical protein JWO95_447, partial [Verrucomicrobiales bacterium]|nr:hypothetical protein [Verrucomicrobiales bacterium]